MSLRTVRLSLSVVSPEERRKLTSVRSMPTDSGMKVSKKLIMKSMGIPTFSGVPVEANYW